MSSTFYIIFCRVLKSKQAEDIYFEQRGNIKENGK